MPRSDMPRSDMPRSEHVALWDSIARDILGRVRTIAGSQRAVVLIDGRSGSGKSSLATELAASWPDAQLVRLDDVYPGWGGLEAASAQVAERMLAASDPAWQRWDWANGRAAEWVALDPRRPLIIEGVGALSRANRALATFGVWVELDDVSRKARALARDGALYAPHWDDWAAQEVRFIAREEPRRLADLVVQEEAVWASILGPQSDE